MSCRQDENKQKEAGIGPFFLKNRAPTNCQTLSDRTRRQPARPRVRRQALLPELRKASPLLSLPKGECE